ncbi:LacI family transcriptional regulator (plasmid) [Rhizobium sp. Pop5]|uniref:LacI family transcriptional regulator n=1 Tax=Rhizobium sp. Pop5 TaxID=1223565 RepID=UPI000565611A|nr:LacI family transcriptional regulator [Rhizobium sp. Pop5]UVD60621.1 LacI family transcriptional regulator [Rhizobium sp. Pop5]
MARIDPPAAVSPSSLLWTETLGPEAGKQRVAALEYRPNELARSMSTGRSGFIGVVVGDIENAFCRRHSWHPTASSD